MAARGPAPLFHPLAARLFEGFFLPWRKFHLGDLHFLNLPPSLPEGRPVMLVGNHVSNWDGFLFREIQRRLRPRWPIYSVMLAEELRRYPIFRLLGGIGIRPESPASVAAALRSVRALSGGAGPRGGFFLSYFPQGMIYPSFKRPLDFRAGINLFLKAMAPMTLIPVGLHMEPMRKLSPAFFVSLGRPMRIDRAAPVHRLVEDLVQAEIDKIHALLSRHGETWPNHIAALPQPVTPS